MQTFNLMNGPGESDGEHTPKGTDVFLQGLIWAAPRKPLKSSRNISLSDGKTFPCIAFPSNSLEIANHGGLTHHAKSRSDRLGSTSLSCHFWSKFLMPSEPQLPQWRGTTHGLPLGAVGRSPSSKICRLVGAFLTLRAHLVQATTERISREREEGEERKEGCF